MMMIMVNDIVNDETGIDNVNNDAGDDNGKQ